MDIIQCSADPDGSGFFADPDPGFKSPDPFMIYDLNDGFDKVLEPKLEPNSAVGLQFSMNSSRLTCYQSF